MNHQTNRDFKVIKKMRGTILLELLFLTCGVFLPLQTAQAKFPPESAALSNYIYDWHTFYGSSGTETGSSSFVDGQGNIYTAGYSQQNWLGDQNAQPLHAHSGGMDLTLIKTNSSGVYQWHTFFPGASGDPTYVASVTGDADGNIYLLGTSSQSWLGEMDAAPLHPYSGNTDLVVIKLNSSGVYQWHTFYGSTIYDRSLGIAAGSDGLYFLGISRQNWLGTNDTAPLQAYSAAFGVDNAVVIKLDFDGDYQWHTFYGNICNYPTNALSLDSSNNVVITGSSSRSWGSPKHAFSGMFDDITVIKLDSNGNYLWHTFYGSSAIDYSQAVAVAPDGAVYVAGFSPSWNGDQSTAPKHAYTSSGSFNGFLLKLDTNGVYQWHTFYNAFHFHGLAADENGNVYAVGSSSYWLNDDGTAPLHGTGNIILLKLDAGGNYLWHTYYGPSSGSVNGDEGMDVKVGTNHTIYLTGHVGDTWLGDNNQAPLHAFTASQDMTLIKLHENLAPTSAASSVLMLSGSQYTFTLADFPFVDVNEDTLQKVLIVSLPDKGALYLDQNSNLRVDSGESIIAGQEISADEINAGKMKFFPSDNGTGNAYTGFQFKVSDGFVYSTAASTLIINILPGIPVTGKNLIFLPLFEK